MNLKNLLPIFLTCFMLNFSYAQDWANLARFQADNDKLLAAGVDENRIVFMGNSITEGWLNIRPEFFKDKPFVNRGIGGQTTPQMLIRFRPDVVDLQPKAVVILAGINDIAGNTGPSTIKMIFDNLVSMTEIARANNIEVLLCSVVPAFDFPWRPGLEPAGKVVELNTLLKGYADEQAGVLYVDYFSAMVNDVNGLKDELGSDGVHPNEAGYLVMEPILERVLSVIQN
ncbi:MAG: SGNH/GDSL hydrolase family protein [Saprospiraceae bacterium]